MQHTTKYKFNLIETSDTFSPEALNANAQQLETELARVEAAADAGSGAVKSELTAALNTAKSELQAADSAIRADFAAADTAQKSELQASITALTTAMGSGGSNARIATGSYVGTGDTTYTRTLTFPFKPAIVFLGCADGANSNHWPSVMIYGCSKAHGDQGSDSFTVSWTSTSVKWSYSSMSNNGLAHNNYGGTTYYYVVIGT